MASASPIDDVAPIAGAVDVDGVEDHTAETVEDGDNVVEDNAPVDEDDNVVKVDDPNDPVLMEYQPGSIIHLPSRWTRRDFTRLTQVTLDFEHSLIFYTKGVTMLFANGTACEKKGEIEKAATLYFRAMRVLYHMTMHPGFKDSPPGPVRDAVEAIVTTQYQRMERRSKALFGIIAERHQWVDKTLPAMPPKPIIPPPKELPPVPPQNDKRSSGGFIQGINNLTKKLIAPKKKSNEVFIDLRDADSDVAMDQHMPYSQYGAVMDNERYPPRDSDEHARPTSRQTGYLREEKRPLVPVECAPSTPVASGSSTSPAHHIPPHPTHLYISEKAAINRALPPVPEDGPSRPTEHQSTPPQTVPKLKKGTMRRQTVDELINGEISLGDDDDVESEPPPTYDDTMGTLERLGEIAGQLDASSGINIDIFTASPQSQGGELPRSRDASRSRPVSPLSRPSSRFDNHPEPREDSLEVDPVPEYSATWDSDNLSVDINISVDPDTDNETEWGTAKSHLSDSRHSRSLSRNGSVKKSLSRTSSIKKSAPGSRRNSILKVVNPQEVTDTPVYDVEQRLENALVDVVDSLRYLVWAKAKANEQNSSEAPIRLRDVMTDPAMVSYTHLKKILDGLQYED